MLFPVFEEQLTLETVFIITSLDPVLDLRRDILSERVPNGIIQEEMYFHKQNQKTDICLSQPQTGYARKLSQNPAYCDVNSGNSMSDLEVPSGK